MKTFTLPVFACLAFVGVTGLLGACSGDDDVDLGPGNGGRDAAADSSISSSSSGGDAGENTSSSSGDVSSSSGGTDAGDTDAGDIDAGDTDAGDIDAGDVDAGPMDPLEAQARAACEEIRQNRLAVGCTGDAAELANQAQFIDDCAAERLQRNGACEAEFVAEFVCQGSLDSTDYECVSDEPNPPPNAGVALVKLSVDTCSDEYYEVYDCLTAPN